MAIKNNRKRDLGLFILSLAIIILINVVGNFSFSRWDLTADKRYTLSESTKELLESVDDYVYFKVYLEGDFPASFRNLRDETQRMLNEFRAISPFIEYEFIDPSAEPDKETRYAIYRQLQDQGLEPTTLQVSEGEDRSESVIFPGAIVSYRSKDQAISLLNSGTGANSDVILNNSVQMLEYQLALAIQRSTQALAPKIGFLRGHGELADEYIQDFRDRLRETYFVEPVDIRTFEVDSISGEISLEAQQAKLQTYNMLIIAKPQSAFTDLDLFLVDQYIMNGGATLWLVDAVHAEMDSLAKNQRILTFPKRDLNVDKLLFTYGARVNYNLIQDLNAAPILVPEAKIGSQNQWALRAWPYFPMVRGGLSNHPIVKNVVPLKTEFISSVDSIIVPGVQKEFILFSSPYSKLIKTPNTITLELLNETNNPENYTQEPVPVGLLLEGRFPSFYKNGIPKDNKGQRLQFREQGLEAKMIVLGDGDIIKNQIARGKPYPLGVDKWTYERTGLVYGNKSFLENAVDYLLDKNGLMQVRSKQIQLRLQNKAKVQEDKLMLQLSNILLPLLLISLLAMSMFYIRKRKFAQKSK